VTFLRDTYEGEWWLVRLLVLKVRAKLKE
jgi:hypothetical protein